MTLQTKLGIAALTLGSGGVATYAALAPKVRGTEIGKLIEDEFRYVLLDTTAGSDNKNGQEWGQKWTDYYTNNKDSQKDVFGLEGWTKGENKQLKDKLIKKCEELKKTEVPSRADSLYENVTKYCVRDVTIEDHAKRDKLDLISTEGSAIDPDWAKVATKKEKLKKHFTSLGIDPHTDGNYKPEAVKKGCTDATKKNKGESKYDEIYNSYKTVCVKEATKTEE